MNKKLTMGVIALTLAGGLFAGQTASAAQIPQLVSSAISSDASTIGEENSARLIILKNAAEILGINLEELLSGSRFNIIQKIKTRLSESKMELKEFISVLKEKINSYLDLSQFPKSNVLQAPLVRLYLKQTLTLLEKYPTLTFAVFNKLVSALNGRLVIPTTSSLASLLAL